jgi:hypothetical protein
MKKQTRIILVFCVAIAILVGGALCCALFLKQSAKTNGYSMVYLISGQAYVGKLSFFPTMRLKDVYLLEMVKDPQDAAKTNFQLSPLKDSIWSPKTVYLIKKNVAFYAPVGETSEIAKSLKKAVKR